MVSRSGIVLVALLFDLDGVLVSTCDMHYEAFNEALWRVAGFRLTREDHVANFDGLPTKTKIAKLVHLNWLKPWQAIAVNEAKQRATMELVPQYVTPDEQKQRMLRELQRSYYLGCVSNCTRANLDLQLRVAKIRRFFRVTISNVDAPHPKPAPDPYLAAMKRLKVTPQQCVAIEDNQRGIDSAVSAGIECLRMTYDELTLESLLSRLTGLHA